MVQLDGYHLEDSGVSTGGYYNDKSTVQGNSKANSKNGASLVQNTAETTKSIGAWILPVERVKYSGPLLDAINSAHSFHPAPHASGHAIT
jgi:hypothetical protein